MDPKDYITELTEAVNEQYAEDLERSDARSILESIDEQHPDGTLTLDEIIVNGLNRFEAYCLERYRGER